MPKDSLGAIGEWTPGRVQGGHGAQEEDEAVRTEQRSGCWQQDSYVAMDSYAVTNSKSGTYLYSVYEYLKSNSTLYSIPSDKRSRRRAEEDRRSRL